MTDMPRPARPILLHRYALSGHAHRAELLLSLLGLPFEKIEVDLARGEQKTPQFLALNPFGVKFSIGSLTFVSNQRKDWIGSPTNQTIQLIFPLNQPSTMVFPFSVGSQSSGGSSSARPPSCPRRSEGDSPPSAGTPASRR